MWRRKLIEIGGWQIVAHRNRPCVKSKSVCWGKHSSIYPYLRRGMFFYLFALLQGVVRTSRRRSRTRRERGGGVVAGGDRDSLRPRDRCRLPAAPVIIYLKYLHSIYLLTTAYTKTAPAKPTP